MPLIQFLIQSKKNPAGIYVRLREGRSIDIKIRTRYAINHEDWSTSKKYLKHTKDENLRKLDLELQNLRTNILNSFNNSVNNTPITANWLKSVINPTSNSKIPLFLAEYFEYYREIKRNQISNSTYNKLSVIKNFILIIEKRLRRKILISEIDESFKDDFLNIGLQEGYSQNYLSRNFSFIKTICYHAELKGIKLHPSLKKAVIKNTSTPVLYLTKEEIDLIEKVKLERDTLSNARDWLIISCETAQRVSDFLNYKSENIFKKKLKTKDGYFIKFTQQKTKKKMFLPLSKRVMKIINKNNGSFPRKISDQRYNEYIKEVAKIAGLTQIVYGGKQNPETKRKEYGNFPKHELITSHIGRRSFASNHYLSTPNKLIMEMTGHKSETEFLKYIGKTDTVTAELLGEYIC